MHNCQIASEDDWPEIANYLDQKLLENAWLAGHVYDCLHDPGWQDSYVLARRDGGGITGAACVTPSDRGEMSVFFHGDTTEALQGLLEALPRDKTVRLRVYDSKVQDHLSKFPDLEQYPCELYYRLNPDEFTPLQGAPVIQLSPDDDRLFDGCEQNPPQWEYYGADHRIFAIVIDGRIATKVGVSFITPTMPSGRRVVAISGLETESKHRRKGLGKRLVSYITETILNEGNIPMYWTETDNIASQGLCQSLGYKRNTYRDALYKKSNVRLTRHISPQWVDILRNDRYDG